MATDVMTDIFNETSSQLGISLGTVIFFFTVIIIWTTIWKGLALWKAARNKSVLWFVPLLVLNTMGILEILYIFIFSKIKLKEKPKRKVIVKFKKR